MLERAPNILKQDKGHEPMLFVFGEHDNAIVLLNFKDTDSKDAGMFIAGKKLAFLLPYCIAFVSEAWMSKAILPEGKHVSDMPDRQEVLQIVAQNMHGEILATAIPFTRVGGEILLGEPISGKHVESYLLKLFWKGVIEGDH